MSLDQAFAQAIAETRAGRLEQAEAIYRQILADHPDSAEASFNLANVLRRAGRIDDAIAAYRRALAVKPAFPEAMINLALLLKAQGNLQEAVDLYSQLSLQKPDDAAIANELCKTLSDLGNSLSDQGRPAEAIACFRRAIDIAPDDSALHSRLLFLSLMDPTQTAQSQLAEHREWNRRHAQPLASEIRPHGNDRNPNRRLRIGYVSPDLALHVVGFAFLPLMRLHNRNQFEIICYSSVRRPDDVTRLFQAAADQWRDILAVDDMAAAQLVREDRIDILVDMSMHMGGHRLLLFARKPAPVQVTFMYPGTTGLTAIDYRLTDPYLDPHGQHDEFYSERSIRLPHTFLWYNPPADDPLVGPLPALKNGYITFGSLGNFYKISDATLDLWARVLSVVPKSRLLLLAPPGAARNRVQDYFSSRGITAYRLEFVDRQTRHDYLLTYNRIDIALETLPYNGHTTSLDAFWMGVPTITRIGNTVVGRAGWSELSNLNLCELAAETDEQFVSIVATLAGDIPKLSALRAGLRQRMLQSPLMDAAGFARDVESAYRRMWHNWCTT